jgi:hypothetical protein
MIDLKVDHLEMNSGLFSELRRYNKPPEIVHKVIQATLLLFEEDEARTEVRCNTYYIDVLFLRNVIQWLIFAMDTKIIL